MNATNRYGRYDRQERIEGWDQTALARARVLVAGAGALGNEVIKNLALLGVGHLLIVDFDRIELSNLSRTALFRDEDIGRPKAAVAAEAATRLNPDVDVRFVDGDLFYDIGLGFYRHVNLVVGCLDSLAARWQVGVSCALAGVAFLDGGMWALGGEARWLTAGAGPCFACTLSRVDHERIFERHSCTGMRLDGIDLSQQHTPTTITTAAVIGGLLAQEAARYLCGWNVRGGEAVVFNGLRMSMHRAELRRDPKCAYHEPYRDVIELDQRTSGMTGVELLQRAEADLGESAIIELGRDFLLGFHCRRCGQRESVNKPLNRVGESAAKCPACGAVRLAVVIARLDGSESPAARRLSELGAPPGEALAVRAKGGLRLYEFTGDVTEFWA